MPKLTLNSSKKTKHTPAGEIPVDWGWAKLRELIKGTQLGGNYAGSNQFDGTALMKMGNMLRGYFTVKSFERLAVDQEINPRDILYDGDLLLNTRNTLELVGKVALWRSELAGAVFNSNMMRLVPDAERIESTKFLNYIFNSDYCLREIKQRATGTTSVGAVYWRDLATIPIPLPPLPEQRRIADILTTWDRAIETLETLIAAKQRRKQALMQQLLTGKKRLPGFNQSKGRSKKDRFETYPADWEHLRLGQVVTETGKRNNLKGDHPVLSCTKHQGLVLSEDYFGRRVHAEDTSNYRVVRRGEFAYATNHIEEGSIGYQDLCDAGLVSPIYTVFKPNKTISSSYLFRVLKSPLFLHLYQTNTSASVDRRGSLRFKEFAQLPIWLPSMKEQEAISSVFNTAERELTLHHQHLATLRTQKRGLMKKLLTGEIRTIQP